jgi:hypothetical protein
MIIEHSTYPIDQHGEAFPTMGCGSCVVQPGVEAGGVGTGHIDQRLAGPRPEIALAQLRNGLGGSA